MSALPARIFRHPFRLLGSAALLALVPKCGVCLLAYAGLGAALGLRVPEICGATTGFPVSKVLLLSVAGLGLVFASLSAILGRRVTAAGPAPEAPPCSEGRPPGLRHRTRVRRLFHGRPRGCGRA